MDVREIMRIGVTGNSLIRSIRFSSLIFSMIVILPLFKVMTNFNIEEKDLV